ncbi:MAG: ion transporter [Methanomicrobiaceae archaeon]|nr:ion transporter [Methanomicrobiaceae archaeon]
MKLEDIVIRTPRQKVYNILNRGISGYRPGEQFNTLMFLFITIIIINVIIQTVPGIPENIFLFGRLLDSLAVFVFTAEYILRAWVCIEDPEYQSKKTADTAVFGRLRYMASGMAIIDLVSLFWFYLPFFFPEQDVYAMIGILKFFTIFKLVRYSPSLHIIVRVFNAKKRQLAMMLYIILFMLIVTSAVMFYIEHQAQPEKFASIPDSMWWAIITLTTVGYGDVYPITPLGKFFGGLAALFGIGLIALPTGILASAFMEEVSNDEDEDIVEDDIRDIEEEILCKCPGCGHEFSISGKKNRD